MGMYTEIFFRAEVDERAYMLIEDLADGVEFTFDHPLFKKARARNLFRGWSAYFPGANHFERQIVEYGPSLARYVSFRSNLKNYDGEIEAFFDWVLPYVLTAGFIGYSLYEEAREPTLYFKEETTWLS